ncbi:hypothetical protein SESBI_38198 [Sesbania bispinosa]|nr:hypothetical protein SESBI_38198 [Sesbania bispinosa]
MAFFGTRIQITPWFNFNPSHGHKLLLLGSSKTWMSMSQGKSKRPICLSCSKPARTCLCSRILTPGIENSVNVTILQHALECKHPLNSTRIARLGLKNLTLATVSDVNFEARFLIQLLHPNSKPSSVGNMPNGSFSHEIGETRKFLSEKDSNLIDCAGKCGLKNDVGDVLSSLPAEVVDQISISDGVVVNDEVEKNTIHPNCDLSRGVHEENGGAAITVTIGKYGAISSLSHVWMPQCQSPKLSFNKILACPEACEALSKGFLVQKFQRKQMNEDNNLEECEEFELEVGPGSVLLFPSDKAVNISDLDAIGFEVKNLIVLDGTWAKAKRIYSENPWLNILPHVKLEVKEMSLYSDVRHQPKAGYLSTIESIVFALKAFGDNHEGLDNLLDTFESMVGDQRRCKNERLSKHSAVIKIGLCIERYKPREFCTLLCYYCYMTRSIFKHWINGRHWCTLLARVSSGKEGEPVPKSSQTESWLLMLTGVNSDHQAKRHSKHQAEL